jgi:hypothetical protein
MLREVGVIIPLALTGAVPATSAAAGDGQIRFGHFAADGPNVDVYVDGDVVLEDIAPAVLTDFVEVEPGTTSVVVVPTGEAVDAPIFPALDVAVEAQHSYSVSVIGQAGDDSLQPLLIDETKAMSGCDMSTSVFRILINNIAGAPPISFYEAGRFLEKNVASGDYSAACFPAFAWDTGRAVVGEDLDNIVFDFDSEEDGSGGYWEPYTVYMWGLMGQYPGTPDEDYFFGGGNWFTIAPDPVTFLAAFSGLGLTGDSELYFEFDTLVEALRSTGLDELLSDGTPRTVFAPTDQAFAALPEGMLEQLMSDPEATRDLLLGHVIEGGLTYDDLANAESLTTMAQTEVVVGQPRTEEDFHFYLGDDVRISDFNYPLPDGSQVWLIDNLSLLVPPTGGRTR